MREKISIVVVDDHPMFRLGVIDTLKQEPDFDVLGQGDNVTDAIRLAKEHLPNIILLDVNMTGNGISVIAEIASQCPVVKIVMLTVSEDEQNVIEALAEGANGYMLKGVSGPDFLAAIRSVHAGDGYVPPRLAARLLVDAKKMSDVSAEADLLKLLTHREEEILQLVSDGLSNREIGDRLNLREKSVKTYMTNILQKLRVRNRVKAALIAQRRRMAHHSS